MLEVTLSTVSATGPIEGLTTPAPRYSLSFVHNSSSLGDFNAIIVVDGFSNSLLNMTLYNASGMLNGYIRRFDQESGDEIDSFSVHVPMNSVVSTTKETTSVGSAAENRGDSLPSSTTTVSIVTRIKPYPLHNSHVICLRPDDGVRKELCRPLQSIHYQLEVNTMRNEWSDALGVCPQCNKISVDGFMR